MSSFYFWHWRICVLMRLNKGAFYNCSGLTSVTIGNGVTSIGDYAFEDCSGLTCVIWNAENCTSAGSWDYPIFKNCNNLTQVTIGENVKTIPSSAFYNCSGLTSITIPESVTSIRSWAFEDCSGLTSITIPNSVTSIGNSAFRGCSGLTSVIWNAENCTSAGSSVYHIFENCNNLTQVTIGENVKTIPSYAFYNCGGLTNIYITDLTAWCKISGISNLMAYGTSNKKLYLNNELVTKLVIPDSVTSIGGSAFV